MDLSNIKNNIYIRSLFSSSPFSITFISSAETFSFHYTYKQYNHHIIQFNFLFPPIFSLPFFLSYSLSDQRSREKEKEKKCIHAIPTYIHGAFSTHRFVCYVTTIIVCNNNNITITPSSMIINMRTDLTGYAYVPYQSSNTHTSSTYLQGTLVSSRSGKSRSLQLTPFFSLSLSSPFLCFLFERVKRERESEHSDGK